MSIRSIRLFFDKFAGHHGINTIADNIAIEDLDDGSYNLVTNQEAMDLVSNAFPDYDDAKFLPSISPSTYILSTSIQKPSTMFM